MLFRTIVPNGYGGGTTAREHVNNPAYSLEDAQRVADRTPGAYVERSTNGLAWERVAADVPTATPTDAPAPTAPDADPFDTSGPWVDVVFVDGDDYETAVDAANDNGGSTDAVAEYLSQWDYGDETDAAHTRDVAPWGSADTLHSVTVGGIDYVLSVNHQMGYYSLNRRPLA